MYHNEEGLTKLVQPFVSIELVVDSGHFAVVKTI